MPAPSIFQRYSKSIGLLTGFYNSLGGPCSNSPSPLLDAIQQMPGTTPGEKFRELNAMVQNLASKSKEKNTIEQLSELPKALLPLLEIMAAEKLGLTNVLVKGLKSEDQTIVDQALKSKFLFHESQPILNPEYVTTKILPYVSLKTRARIIKNLANCLSQHELRAQEFFLALVELYGVEQSLPLLRSCSKEFIYDQILKHKLVVPVKMLDEHFRRHPTLVIQYLHLGNKNHRLNESDREHHTIPIHEYGKFLPKLVENYVEDFVALYDLTPEQKLNLGKKKTKYFLKNALKVLIKNPSKFLELLDLKIVTDTLSEEDFYRMIKNLYPEYPKGIAFERLIKFLEYYPKDRKWDLLKKTYRDKYGSDILDTIDSCRAYRIMSVLPADERDKQARIWKKTDRLRMHWELYFHPTEFLKICKDSISKASDMFQRITYLKYMIRNCHIYDSQEHLAMFLAYYNSRHKNEQSLVLSSTLAEVVKLFDLEKLSQECWAVLKEIVWRAYVKDELFSVEIEVMETFFRGALRAILIEKNLDHDWFEKLVNLILEYRVKEKNDCFNFVKDHPAIERSLLDKFLSLVAQKYPKDDPVWVPHVKINIVINFVESMQDFNRRNKCKAFKVKDHRWMVNLIKEIYTSDFGYPNKRRHLKRLLKLHEREIYDEIMTGSGLSICSVETGEALDMLRRNPDEILQKWQTYLQLVAEELTNRQNHRAVKFIKTTKWHKDIPILFVNHSMKHIKEKGHIFVLSILLDKRSFSELISNFKPKKTMDSKEEYQMVTLIPSAMTLVNPPPSFDLVEPFCEGDYCYLGLKALNNIANRTTVPKVIEFCKKLLLKKVGMQKQAVRILFRILPNEDLNKFVEETWNSEAHNSLKKVIIGEIIASMPLTSDQSRFWEMLKKCITNTTDENCMSGITCHLNHVLQKHLYADYLQVVISKLEESEESSNKSIFQHRMLSDVLRGMNDDNSIDRIPENVWDNIVKNLFQSKANHNIIIEQYLLSADYEKFENRLKVVMDDLNKKIIEKWDVPSPLKPREFPANSAFGSFVSSVTMEVVRRDYPNSKAVVAALAEIFSSHKLLPWKDPRSYLMIQFCQLYLHQSDARGFGNSCGRELASLIKLFATDLILTEVETSLNKLVETVFRYKNQSLEEFLSWKLDLIEGLMEGDDLYGSYVATKLLKSEETSKYGPKYDEIVDILRRKPHIAIQFSVNAFSNKSFDPYGYEVDYPISDSDGSVDDECEERTSKSLRDLIFGK